MKEKSFKHFAELRNTFGSADLVAKDVVVFNIQGNHYRLVTRISFEHQAVYIKWFGRHKDYDNITPLEVKHDDEPC